MVLWFYGVMVPQLNDSCFHGFMVPWLQRFRDSMRVLRFSNFAIQMVPWFHGSRVPMVPWVNRSMVPWVHECVVHCYISSQLYAPRFSCSIGPWFHVAQLHSFIAQSFHDSEVPWFHCLFQTQLCRNKLSNLLSLFLLQSFHCFLFTWISKDFASPLVLFDGSCILTHDIPDQGICHTENSKQIFPEMTLRGIVSKSYIHVSVSNLYVYSHDQSAYSAAGKQFARLWKYTV